MRWLVAVLVALVLAAPAQAAKQTPWHLPYLDQAVRDTAGVSDLTVISTDNQSEWDYLAGGPGAAGWTCVLCYPGARLYDPFTGYVYNVYHTVWVDPDVWATLKDVTAYGIRDGIDFYKLGLAMLTLDHEAMHWRLVSGDEARVNACAIDDLPRFLTAEWHLVSTELQTIQVPQQYRVRVKWKRVKVHGRLVWKYRYVWKTRYVTETQTVPNHLLTAIVNGANAFRASQPPPYNSGTCS